VLAAHASSQSQAKYSFIAEITIWSLVTSFTPSPTPCFSSKFPKQRKLGTKLKTPTFQRLQLKTKLWSHLFIPWQLLVRSSSVIKSYAECGPQQSELWSNYFCFNFCALSPSVWMKDHESVFEKTKTIWCLKLMTLF